jgi:hypothetical protein
MILYYNNSPKASVGSFNLWGAEMCLSSFECCLWHYMHSSDPWLGGFCNHKELVEFIYFCVCQRHLTLVNISAVTKEATYV